RTGGLVVGAGSRKRGAVRSGDVRDAERDAAPVALDRKGRAARCRDLVSSRPGATRRHAAVRRRRPGRAAPAAGVIPLWRKRRWGWGWRARRGGGRHVFR